MIRSEMNKVTKMRQTIDVGFRGNIDKWDWREREREGGKRERGREKKREGERAVYQTMRKTKLVDLSSFF